MNTTIRISTIPARILGCVLAATFTLLCGSHQMSAQWTAGDAQRAFTAYNNAFLHTESDGFSKYFATAQGTTTHEILWKFAEEIEMAIDAYYENPTSANQNEVEALCDGFIYQHGDNWSSDTFNDDLDVAIIAFARAFHVTGTTRWKSDAQINYSTVWNRAQAGDGGLCQNSNGSNGKCPSGGGYENSSANWSFVIAAMLLNQIDPNGTGYKSQGDGVYSWAWSHLYNSSTGEIYDSKSGNVGQYTLNYGLAIGAGNEEGDSSLVANVASYAYNGFHPDGSQPVYEERFGGYNVLPDYGQGDLNDSGFNGALCRWVNVANGHGLIGSAVIAAQKANTNALWNQRDGSNELIWNDWDRVTTGTQYSWDDSAAVACLLDTPPTS